jgi:hypothetical protein
MNLFKRTMAIVRGYMFRNALFSESDCVHTSNVKIPTHGAVYFYIYTLQFKSLIGGDIKNKEGSVMSVSHIYIQLFDHKCEKGKSSKQPL